MVAAGRAMILVAGVTCSVAAGQEEVQRLVIYEFAQSTDSQQWRDRCAAGHAGASSDSSPSSMRTMRSASCASRSS